MNKEKILSNYLHLESLLNTLTTKAKYCMSECITKKISKQYAHIPEKTNHKKGRIGCCDKTISEHHRICELLNQEREQKYKPYKNKEKSCKYHSKKTGCALTTHKPIACSSYICPSQINHLKKEFNIDYDQNYTYYFLVQPFEGNVKQHEIEHLEKKLEGKIESIKK